MRRFRSQYGQETASKSMGPGFGLSRDATWLAGDSEIVPGLAPVTAVMSTLYVIYRSSGK